MSQRLHDYSKNVSCGWGTQSEPWRGNRKTADTKPIYMRWDDPGSSSDAQDAYPDRDQQLMEQEIISDVGSTRTETNIDVFYQKGNGEAGQSQAFPWESSGVSSKDEDLDPLFVFSPQNDQCDLSFPVKVPSTDVDGVGSTDSSLKHVSFAHLKPLSGHLVHSISATSSTTATTQTPRNSSVRFREYQAEQWAVRFAELRKFAVQYGHCQVSHRDQEHGALARWCKRQRYQYKLMNEGKKSTMTRQRVEALDVLGFAWNSHEATWEKRLGEVRQFFLVHGHCNIPSTYEPNQKLGTWSKCQRRQYKLLVTSKRSNMTWERVARLDEIGFVWEVRPH